VTSQCVLFKFLFLLAFIILALYLIPRYNC